MPRVLINLRQSAETGYRSNSAAPFNRMRGMWATLKKRVRFPARRDLTGRHLAWAAHRAEVRAHIVLPRRRRIAKIAATRHTATVILEGADYRMRGASAGMCAKSGGCFNRRPTTMSRHPWPDGNCRLSRSPNRHRPTWCWFRRTGGGGLLRGVLETSPFRELAPVAENHRCVSRGNRRH